MAYLVNITARAERDFASLYRKINAEESDAALKWYRGLKVAVLCLEELPNRCPVTPEKARLRHLLYGNQPHGLATNLWPDLAYHSTQLWCVYY